jgi:hypothetical protein
MLARALETRGVPMFLSPLRKRPWRALAKGAGLIGVGRFPFFACQDAAFFHINHPWPSGLYPYRAFHPVVTYSFDCWAPLYEQWEDFFQRTRPVVSFISAKASVAEMKRRCPATEFRWLPEAIDPAEFHPRSLLVERTIDVLELGRRHEQYHASITARLQCAGARHIYAGGDNPIAFSHSECVNLYADSKICLCFPKSTTHPKTAGGVETTTYRYWEAIASKCLLVGHCPQELNDLLGFNPVIEVDFNAPAEQLLDEILPGIDQYQPLVDRNYEALRETWTVAHQADVIANSLADTENVSA